MKNTPKPQLLEVYIRSAEKIEYEGKALGLTAVNESGVFDILPLHANFISIIKNIVKIYEESGYVREIKIDSGVLRVLKNRVELYLGI